MKPLQYSGIQYSPTMRNQCGSKDAGSIPATSTPSRLCWRGGIGSIGIDDGSAAVDILCVSTADQDAQTFADLFRETYLRFHRRDGKRNELSGASRAVLQHLSQTGPLTVGDIALHLDRAQSVISDIVTQLESKGVLERERDPDDRRRTLVWLSPEGFAVLRADRDVLSVSALAEVFAGLPPGERAALLTTLSHLVRTELGNDHDHQL
jgi:DNA-binding MarR family transcriptional regulator